MRTRATARLLLLAVAVGCAGRPSFLRSAPARSWPATLAYAQRAVSGARYADADSALVNFAARYPATPQAAESQYWRALIALDPFNSRQSGTDAVQALDTYFATPAQRTHDAEAAMLRRLAVALTPLREASNEAASQVDSARSSVDSIRTRADSARAARASRERTRDEEVQRLRDSLDKVVTQLGDRNQELDRIKKRLAAPKP